MTESDFANVTSDGRMCDEEGQLAFPQFEAVMRKQVGKALRRNFHPRRRRRGGRFGRETLAETPERRAERYESSPYDASARFLTRIP